MLDFSKTLKIYALIKTFPVTNTMGVKLMVEILSLIDTNKVSEPDEGHGRTPELC
jgi:hypothetical protein